MTNRLKPAETYTHTHTCNILKAIVCLWAVCFSSLATTPDISANTTTASCADTILNTDGGVANIEINWEPNVIPLRWYNGNTMVESNTCTYGNSLTLPPPPPEREGYTFRGWRVRPQYDFSSLPVTGQIREKWCINVVGRCFYNNDEDGVIDNGEIVLCNSKPEFKELQKNEFRLRFDWGNIYGVALCSSETCENGSADCAVWKGADSGLENNPGENCWCKITGYKPLESDVLYSPISTPHYVFSADYGVSAGNCRGGCSLSCTNALRKTTFRKVAFGVQE